MKKFSYLIGLFLFVVLAFPLIGHAASQTTHIVLDGREIDLSKTKGAQVQVVNNSILIPIRVVSEELGFDVNWDSKTETVTIQQPGTIIKLVLGSSKATVNGKSVSLIAAPKATNEVTYVPVRFVSEQMGLKVGWNNTTKTVTLTSTNTGSGSGTVSGGNSGPGGSTSQPVTDPNANLTALTGLSFSDNQLILAVNGNVTPKTSKLTGPNRIVVDLPNVKFGPEFASVSPLDGNQNGQFEVNGYPAVSKVRYSLYSNSPSTVRVVIDLNYANGYQVTNLGDGLIIVDLNQQGSSDPSATVPGGNGKKLVVIDAGHGGTDPGAISTTGKKEKDFTLAVVQKVAALLKNEPDIDFVLTRSGDTYPTLSDRSNLANKLKADVFVSVHGNSGAASASGVETYYTRSDSATFAKIMHKYLVAATGLTDRKVKTSSLHVTRETTMPAVLLECGFLSNKGDEAKMYSSAFQQRVAEGIVAGIKEYLGIK